MLNILKGLAISIVSICVGLWILMYTAHGSLLLTGQHINSAGYYSTEHSLNLFESVYYTREPSGKNCKIRLDRYVTSRDYYVDVDCDGVTDFIETKEKRHLQNDKIITIDIEILHDAVGYQEIFEKMDKLFTDLNVEYLEIINQLSPKS